MSELALALATLVGVLATALPAVLSNVGKRSRLALLRAHLAVYREFPQDADDLERARDRLASEITDIVLYHDANPSRWKTFQRYYVPVVGGLAAFTMGTVLMPGERLGATARSYASCFFLIVALWFMLSLVAILCVWALNQRDLMHQRRADRERVDAAQAGREPDRTVRGSSRITARLRRRRSGSVEPFVRFIVQDIGTLVVAAVIYLLNR